jgi:phenylpropionate dioxygenase-like ring-hydroxylating dioxygenase large terminal subunit
MLSNADNERLCRVGPGTPMGEVFRRFWNPVCLSEQLPEPDGAPLRLQVLGERLVVFRDSRGELGLLDEACPHRGVSLALGRVEDGGIRCLYHGWKFCTRGRVLETPNHDDPAFRERLHTTAYPVREAGGLLWAYMGPPDRQPAFPAWSFMALPPAHVKVVRLDAEVNYLQQLEGGLDTSHVGILHSNYARPGWMTGEFNANPDRDNPAALATGDLMPALEVRDTEFGFHYAALRQVAPRDAVAMQNVRVVPFVLPSTRIIPSLDMQFLLFEIPLGDTRTTTFSVSYRLDGGPFDMRHYDALRGRDDATLFDRASHRYLGSWDNRFGQDREAMRDSWSGVRGVVMEDLAMAMSQGPIADRSNEHLVPADKAVVRARRLLLESARRVAAGGDPIGAHADVARIVACDHTVPRDARWQALVPGHAEIEPAPSAGA